MLGKNIEQNDLGQLLAEAVHHYRKTAGYCMPWLFTRLDMLCMINNNFDTHIIHVMSCYVNGEDANRMSKDLNYGYGYGRKWRQYFSRYFEQKLLGFDNNVDNTIDNTIDDTADEHGIHLIYSQDLTDMLVVETYNLAKRYVIYKRKKKMTKYETTVEKKSFLRPRNHLLGSIVPIHTSFPEGIVSFVTERNAIIIEAASLVGKTNSLTYELSLYDDAIDKYHYALSSYELCKACDMFTEFEIELSEVLFNTIRTSLHTAYLYLERLCVRHNDHVFPLAGYSIQLNTDTMRITLTKD